MSRLHSFLKPSKKRTVVVPMAQCETVIRCVEYGITNDYADFILIGNEPRIREIAKEKRSDISGATVIHEMDEEATCHKAATMLAEGRAQVSMKGLAQTSTFIKSLLDKRYNLKPENGLISQVALFDIPAYHKVLLSSDAGINVSPTLAEKVKILHNALNVARQLGIRQPKVGCASFVEKVNPKASSTQDAFELSQMKNEFGDAIVEGPMGFDVVVSKEAAQIKEIGGSVAGDADVILYPELNSANMVYKCLTIFCKAKVCGIVAGLRVPVVLTSRADSEEAKELSLLLALSISR